MNILQYYTRVILWGCEVSGNTLNIGLGYFSSNLTTDKIKLKDPLGKYVLTIKIPDEYLKTEQPRRVSNESFLII